MNESVRILKDEEFGHFVIHVNPRARRMTFRVKEDGMHATVPPGTSLTTLVNAINTLRPRLRDMRQKAAGKIMDWNFRIDGEMFSFSLSPAEGKHFQLRQDGERTLLLCPADTDFADSALQAWLQKVLQEAMRRRARLLLPPRLQALSVKHGLPFRSVKINTSAGRWGSCSGRKDINLSCRMMMLPAHLSDYVMLHELAHTREMNHSERFWALLDKLTDGHALHLREELKGYNT